MQHVEIIVDRDEPLAYVISKEIHPEVTTFVTPNEFKQQVGFIVYPAGGEIRGHRHRALERHLFGTSEVLIVRSGRCEIDIYTEAGDLVVTRELSTGDIMLMVGGGHGFRMLEDTVLLEIKQDPYTGLDEKDYF